MKPSENGTYRWRYSVNLYKNPGLLWLFYKVFCGIFAGRLLFGLFLADFKVSLAGAMWTSVGFAVMIAIVTLSYYVYALIQGGLFHNQIFAGDEDFDFVLDYITSHCPKLKKKGT